jgi:tetratricopeptide (TPR) repeat protein
VKILPPQLRGALVAALLLSFAAPASGAVVPEPGLDYFERGVLQYHAGDYASALYLFQLARAQGNRNPNLSFDIALTLYQLGRDEEARRAFENLHFEPGYESIAEYHLGLIALRTGDRDAAAASLRRTATGAEHAPLRQLAGGALARLDGLLPRPSVDAYASIGAGFDTNAGYQADDLQEQSDSADSYYEAAGVLDYPLSGDLFLLGSMHAREYAEMSDYSQQTGQLALRAQTGGRQWRASLTGRAEASWFGGESLHNAGMLILEGRRSAGPGSFVARAASARFVAGNLYPELEGWRHRLGVDYALSRTTVGYQVEVNDRADARDADEFRSRSPVRHQFTLRTRHPLSSRLTLEWRARYRYSHYGDEDRFGGVALRRKDSLAEAGVEARWRLSKAMSLLTEARYARNSSSLDHYEYKRGAGLVSLEWAR